MTKENNPRTFKSYWNLQPFPFSNDFCMFSGMCFAFVLATIIQFASVHFFTKHGSGEVIEESDDEDEGGLLERSNNSRVRPVSNAYFNLIS